MFNDVVLSRANTVRIVIDTINVQLEENSLFDINKVKILLFDVKKFQLPYLILGWTFITFYTSAYFVI